MTVLLLHNVDPAWELAERKAAEAAAGAMKSALIAEGHRVVEVPVRHADLAEILRPFPPECHIVFNWCEELPGIPRSDAMAAQVLEDLNFAYTGSPPEVLSMSWDKAAVKLLLKRQGIPSPRWRLFSTHEADEWNCFPAIVKPAFEHCSCGISTEAVVSNSAELFARIGFVQQAFKQPAIVEDFIDGREFHVTLWGDRTIELLPPAEMDFGAFDNPCDRLCTFDSKFIPGSLHYEKIDLRIPAVLAEPAAERLAQTALRAYHVIGCRDYARIDLRLRDGIFYVLDINPNADISPETSMVYAAESIGIGYGALGSRLIGMAARRRPRPAAKRRLRRQPQLQTVAEE